MKHFPMYKSLCTEFYDLDKPQAPEEELAFYMNYAKEASGRILEPMCGSGRFLIPILSSGYQIDGIDASRFMLDALRKRGERKKLIPLLHESLLQNAILSKKYSLVIIPSGSFCLLTNPSDIKESLQVLMNAMLPNAKLVFEIEMLSLLTEKEKECNLWCGRSVKKVDGSIIMLSSFPHYDKATQIQTTLCKYELVQKNQIIQTEVEEFCIKLYQWGEIENILTQSGFGAIKKWKPYDRKESEPLDSTVIVECTREK